MRRFIHCLILLISTSTLSGQDNYLLDSITTIFLSNGSSGSIGLAKFQYDDECRIKQHKTESTTKTYLYDQNTLTIDFTDNLTSELLTSTVQHYSDFDSLISSSLSNSLGLVNLDSLFYNDDHLLTRHKRYRFAGGIQYLNIDSKFTYVDGLIETDSSLTYNSSGSNIYFRNRRYEYDQDGNELLRVTIDNFAFSQISKDSIISRYDDGRITSKREIRSLEGNFIGEDLWETTYSGQYSTIHLSRRSDVDDPFALVHRLLYHFVNQPIFEYDSAWLYRPDNDNSEFLATKIVRHWLYNDSKDSLITRSIQQNFDASQNVLFTNSVKNLYIRKISEVPPENKEMGCIFLSYPNPSLSNEAVSIESNQEFDLVTVYNEIGQMVFSEKLVLSQHYSLSEYLEPGIYYIRLGKEGQYLEKVIKQIIIK